MQLGIGMFFWKVEDGDDLAIGLIICVVAGALCGAVPLTVGLMRGNKSMAWAGFGISVFAGVGCLAGALVPAIIFTILVAVMEPMGKRGRKGKGPRRRRRQDRADDFLDNERDRRRRELQDDEPRRRRVYDDDDEDDDYDDRPRRRRRYD
jgi:hypothetical protein